MANLSEDIQCAGSNNRPPMLDRSDFASWQQRIRLYCQGKENGVNILKSINEGPFQMGTFRETLGEGEEGSLHLGPERARVYFDLSPEDRERGQGTNARGTSAAGNREAQNRDGNVNPGQAKQIKCYNCNDKMLLMQAQENGVVLDEKQLLSIACGQDNAVDECYNRQFSLT
uniref:Integrase, catalytic region, zinc finger, CCHC-type, peptidase aspartic, catalytic n=1 Tax=Tanacetum cinerariifolium TaxID=118510 RepID=A0A6L2NM81_TANCI|nr:integrase, catalytic region, zinc finger, CCHC-type, peptidase aspartic, catalytic [Tanacetum cinerariifolium]